jgi:hypothetical protein
MFLSLHQMNDDSSAYKWNTLPVLADKRETPSPNSLINLAYNGFTGQSPNNTPYQPYLYIVMVHKLLPGEL